jgi:hypothetical protein
MGGGGGARIRPCVACRVGRKGFFIWVPFRAAAFGGVCPRFGCAASREVAVEQVLVSTLFSAAFFGRREAGVVLGARGFCFLYKSTMTDRA